MNHYKCSKHIYSGAAPCGKCVIEDSRLQMQAIYKSIPGCIGALTHSESQKTLRDEFAMSAVAGLTAATDPDGKWFFDAKDVATEAYLIADAMLKSREVQS